MQIVWKSMQWYRFLRAARYTETIMKLAGESLTMPHQVLSSRDMTLHRCHLDTTQTQRVKLSSLGSRCVVSLDRNKSTAFVVLVTI